MMPPAKISFRRIEGVLFTVLFHSFPFVHSLCRRYVMVMRNPFMSRTLPSRVFLSSALLLSTGGFTLLLSQTPGRQLIRDRIQPGRLVTLRGNTRPEANAANDLGRVADSLPLDHMMLQLKRSPGQEQAVEQFIAELHDPQSPNFHKWLSAAEFGQRFGAAPSDIRTITSWLESKGFTVNVVYPSGMVIDFSGNAGQVSAAFRTEVHNLDVNGVRHIANFSDPEIPAALAPAVEGIVSMHDFGPHTLARRAARKKSGAKYSFTYADQPQQALVPADLATIYDFNPLFAKGITGKGQTIVVLEDTNLYATSDWTTFRNSLGLSQYTIGYALNRSAGAGERRQQLQVARRKFGRYRGDSGCGVGQRRRSRCRHRGGFLLEHFRDFGPVHRGAESGQFRRASGHREPELRQCEAENGSSWNVVSKHALPAGGGGGNVRFSWRRETKARPAAMREQPTRRTVSAVSGLASTPYNVAVGGTDFSDVYSGTSSLYWSATNTADYGSALSYIPEIPWNDSCAGSLLARSKGYSTAYGSGGFCDSSAAIQGGFLVVAGGSGGPSNCATGTPAQFGVTGGTCQGVAKPAWQTGLAGIPNDGVRDIPDVSMFASDGWAWGHYAVICFTDLANYGAALHRSPG